MNEDKENSESGMAENGMVELLNKGISISDELLALLEEERKAILAMDEASLISFSRKKTRLVDRLQQLDRTIAERVRSLRPEQNIHRRQGRKKEHSRIVQISAIAESSPGDLREKLCLSRDQFVTRRRAIADKNYINKRLIEDSLGYLNDAISLFTQTGRDPAYGKKSGSRKNKNLPVLISRAV